MRTVFLAAMACIISGAFLDGQERQAGAIYVTASVTQPYQKGVSGETSETYVAAPGGWSTGWIVGGGVYASPRVSIGAEFGRSGSMSAVEHSRYEMTFHEERRDTFLVLAELGAPVTSEFKEGKRVDVFAFTQGYRKGVKVSRVILHGSADVM